MNVVPLALPINNKDLREECARLIPKIFHSCLEGRNPFGLKSPVFGVAAILEGHAVGIALATAHTKIHIANIHCLAIEKRYAHADLAGRLLQSLTELLLDQKITFAHFIYSKEDSFSIILEEIFPKNSWQGPHPQIIECLFKRAEFNPFWWHKNIPLAEGFEEFLFKNLKQEEQKDLIHRFEQGLIPSFVFPFGHEKSLIEYKNSLGLRYKGKVVGWMITHRIEPDKIRYSYLYLEDDFAYTRYWLKLLIDALKIHKDMHNVTYGSLEINLDQISKRWIKFIERKLYPHTCKITHKNLFWVNWDRSV